MKFNLSDADQRAKDRTAEKEKAAKRIISIGAKISELTQQKAAAADAGDVDTFRGINKELELAQDELEVVQAHHKRLQAESIITREEAAAAWADYSTTYNQSFDKMHSELDHLRSKLMTKYAELIEMQAAAFKVREQLFDYSGMKTHDLGMFDKPYDLPFPCRVLPYNTEDGPMLNMQGTSAKHPDMVYYLAYYAKDNNLSAMELAQQKRLFDILIRHTTKPF